MKTSILTQQYDRQRRITTIYLIDGTPFIVEAIEWGSGSTPVLVRTAENQIWRQGIDASWSSFPNKEIMKAFHTLQTNLLKSQQWDYGSTSVDNREAA